MSKFHNRSLRSVSARLLALTSGCMFGVTANAQAVVDPGSQPYHTLAPYVLESSNLEPWVGNPDGGTFAYRPWFENGAWTGDLIQYFVDPDGRRYFTGGTIGLFPRDGAGWNTMGDLWTARYVFPDFEPYDVTEETSDAWECTELTPDYWQGRNIFTMRGGTQVPFRWNSLGDAQQSVVDPAIHTLQEVETDLKTDPYASPVLNFVRGDRSRERCKEVGIYRWRFSVLGAIVNSRPAYVPAGDGLVVVGANDGMLHGFTARSTTVGETTTYPAGGELWAYIPSMLMPKLGLLRVSPYRPNYYVDGELRHQNIGTTSTPRHIVSGGLGAGGKGLFILDVTSPASPSVSLELSGVDAPYVGGSNSANIGHIHGRPTIAKLGDGKWYVVSGNGYASTPGTAQLVVVPLNGDGSTGDPGYRTTDGATANGLSAPALVDTTGDGKANYAYAGDLRGRLWRFDLKDPGAIPEPQLLFTADAAGKKPITVEPDIAQHPDGLPGFMIYFGTGSLLSAADGTNTDTQSIYGIWDRLTATTVSMDDLVEQTLVTTTVDWSVTASGSSCEPPPAEDSTNSVTVRFAGDPQYPAWAEGDRGWRVDLPRAGERLVGRPQVRAERLQFITINPVDMENLPDGDDVGSWMLQLDLGSGASGKRPRALFDLNNNCMLDSEDGLPSAITVGGYSLEAGAFPLGVHIGPFNVAQPAFARVKYNPTLRSVVDGVYINALQIPQLESVDQVLHGPLDVTTDSAFGAAHTVVAYEAVKAPFETDEKESTFPEASGPNKAFVKADGLGHRVDGHSFAYNKHHGVDFVDLFKLEPRRGQNRLDVGASYLDGGVFKTIPVPSISEQELNKVTEVGIAADQEFIVVLANADLSRENEIKIGCRTWRVYDYQTEVMRALRGADPIGVLRGRGLIFTLDSIQKAIGCSEPTLRITPTERIGKADATMHTLPGCVNNTDLYTGGPPDRTMTRKSELNADGSFVGTKGPGDLYKVAPHATAALEPTGADKKDPPEWQGRRWRNGALTVQLLAVNGDGVVDTAYTQGLRVVDSFTLQDWNHLPRNPGTVEGIDLGWGGAYAKAFDIPTDTVIPETTGLVQPTDATSGMLYELSMFWHWGDMARLQTSGAIFPVCLGAPGHKPRAMFEGDWFTPGEYEQLTKNFTEALQKEYLELLAKIRAGDEAALIRLAEMFKEFPGIADYHRTRHYVPNSKQLNDGHLIAIDRGALDFDAALDGTPAPVVDIEADLLPSLGPNFQPGRRSWIDIAPE